MLSTCKRTEKPPKPRIKEDKSILYCVSNPAIVLIKEIPLVTSIKPENKLIVKLLEIPKKAKKSAKKYSILLVFSIDIIIEKSITKPPIIKIVFIELIMLLDKTSPKLQKDRVEVFILYPEFLYFFSLDIPHHRNKKPNS